jgi:hypothetical protein
MRDSISRERNINSRVLHRCAREELVNASKCLLLFLVMHLPHACFAQQSPQGSQSQPLNSSVSNFGTTYIFSPLPVCAGCIQSELGFSSLEGGRYLPAALTVAPFSSSTDFSVLANLMDSQKVDGDRSTHFGNRFDFVIRQRLLQAGGVVVTAAPRGVVFARDLEGGRIGVSMAAQYSKGSNLAVVNLTYTGAIGGYPANPKNEYQGSMDYFRSLGEKGFAVFVGVQHGYSTGNPQSFGIEAGLVLPFRNGQVELASQQLNLNTNPAWQFQARVTVNWGKVLGR